MKLASAAKCQHFVLNLALLLLLTTLIILHTSYTNRTGQAYQETDIMSHSGSRRPSHHLGYIDWIVSSSVVLTEDPNQAGKMMRMLMMMWILVHLPNLCSTVRDLHWMQTSLI